MSDRQWLVFVAATVPYGLGVSWVLDSLGGGPWAWIACVALTAVWVGVLAWARRWELARDG